MSIAQIKEHASLIKAAAPEYELKEGYQQCPFCSRPKKFKVSEDRWFKCYHPSCVASSGGDVITFLQTIGKAKDFGEAVAIASSGVNLPGRAWYKRLDVLRLAFNAYTCADSHPAVLKYLRDRSLGKVLVSHPIGYAPDETYLQSQGLVLKDLVDVGLAYPSGREFFSNRVIFPIRDRSGAIVHMQGRSLDPNVDLRWLSTPSNIGTTKKQQVVPPINSFLFNTECLNESCETVYLTEGISDGYSLLELGKSAVSCFGLEPRLVKYADSFAKAKKLIAVFDNDRYPHGSELGGLYKSWSRIVPHLIELAEHVTSLEILCLTPPTSYIRGKGATAFHTEGIKDINDWIVAGLTPSDLDDYAASVAKPLVNFAIDMYGSSWEHQLTLLKVLALDLSETNLNSFRDVASRLEPDPIKYAVLTAKYHAG